ncbi:MAG: type VI secretion system lipoprotein TssJ [Vicinamibacterales bacterium]
MTRPTRLVPVAVWIAAVASATGCAKAPPALPPSLPPVTIAAPAAPAGPLPTPAVRASLTIGTTVDTNPDASGRPSPVVIRIYQLRADGPFVAAEFFNLFDDADKALGQALVTKDEYVMAPGERRSLDVTFASETRFVGVMAAFRDVRNAQWRAVVPVPRGTVTVLVERARVAVTTGN